jgi:hypothetical protein
MRTAISGSHGFAAAVAMTAALAFAAGAANAAQPITIGFGMGLTGGLAAAGKAA